MNKKILSILAVLMLGVLVMSGCIGNDEPVPDEPTNGNGEIDDDIQDAFPDDPDLSRFDIIEHKTITLEQGQTKTINFNTTIQDKYAVVYWEIQPFNDEAGESIAFRFKTAEGWEMDLHRGKTNQITRNVTIDNYGNWSLWIKHDGLTTGYELPIEVDYRIFVLG